jgi:hypothetical protein
MLMKWDLATSIHIRVHEDATSFPLARQFWGASPAVRKAITESLAMQDCLITALESDVCLSTTVRGGMGDDTSKTIMGSNFGLRNFKFN